MDLSQFLDVSCDVGDEPLETFTEDDIVFIDEPVAPKNNGNKRVHSGGAKAPPAKRAKPIGRKQPTSVNLNQFGMKKTNLTQHAVGILSSSNLTVKKIVVPQKANNAQNRPAAVPAGRQIPKPLVNNPITWKYKQLTENLYNGDIRKADLLKDYEPEPCMCKEPPPGELACGEGCINRSTFTECDKEVCQFGERCGNQKIQRRQYAPGLERFMTQKKGWGVRARQAISAGTLILEYMGELCTAGEFEKRMLNRYRGDTHHYCLALDSKTVIDAQRAGSECRFVNHSCDPNCEMEKWNVNGLYRMAVFAKRDILPGEEITYDYNFSLFNTSMGQECKCGAADCRGVIGGKGKDFLITLNDGGEVNSPSPNRKVAVATDPSGQVATDDKWFRAKLAEDDLAWIQTHAPKPGQLEAKTIKCTVCNEYLNFKVVGQIQRHPELGVILCNKCRKNYGKGGWARDPEGNDEFCRWCSEGGQVYLCDFCPKAFCNKCLKWNLGRKYMKDIESQDKWKCLLCDPSVIRAARAEYWAVHCYHKDRSEKASLKPKHMIKNGSAKNSPVAKRLSMTGRPVPGIRPIIKNGSPMTKNGVPFVKTVAPAGRLLPTVRPSVLTGGVEYKKHYVDSMLLEADRAANKLRSMINDIRKSWYNNQARDDKTIILATKKIREAFAAAHVNLETADKKVLEIFRTNLDEADIRDIEPELVDKQKEEEEKIFAKAAELETLDIENVETVPDLPFPLEEEDLLENGEKEESVEESNKNTEIEDKDGIHDMSIEELEEHPMEEEAEGKSKDEITIDESEKEVVCDKEIANDNAEKNVTAAKDLGKETSDKTPEESPDTDEETADLEVAENVEDKDGKADDNASDGNLEELEETVDSSDDAANLANTNLETADIEQQSTAENLEPKKTTADVHKESTADVHKESTADVQKESTADVQKESRADVQQESTSDVQKESTADVQKESTADVQQKSTADVQQESTADVQQESTADVQKESIADVRQESTDRAAKDRTEDVGPTETVLAESL